jgi:hypothetical protein
MDSDEKAKEYLAKAFNYVVAEFLDKGLPEDIELELESIVAEILDERNGLSFESEIDEEEDDD